MSSSKKTKDNAETMPNNLEAERALLGWFLYNSSTLEDVNDYLRPEHFFMPIHGKIFETIQRVIAGGGIADAITLKTILSKDDSLKSVGGESYLVELADSVFSDGGTAISDYGRLIYDLFLRRQLIQIGHEMVQESRQFDLDVPATQHIENAEKKLYDLATKGHFSHKPFGLAVGYQRMLQQAEETHYRKQAKLPSAAISSGLIDLDNMLDGGFHPSQLIVIGGRPAMGKTSLATNIAFFNATQNKTPTLFISLEMAEEELLRRFVVSKIEGLNSKKIKQGDLSSDELKDLKNFTEYMENIPLHIEDSPALTIPAIRNLARRFKRQHNIGLIVIDHLGIIENNISSENRVQEISKFSRALKGLAKELKVPVILLSQLNRGVESRDNKRPWLSDLRDSGSIEQDADVVIFPYREKYYENRKKLEDAKKGNGESISFKQTVQPEPDSDVLEFAEIIIAKHRDGEVGTVNVLFDSEKTTFRNAQK